METSAGWKILLREGLRIRGDLPAWWRRLLAATFVLLVLGAWYLLTRGPVGARAVSPLILPSPGEVLSAFGPLHWKMGLTRSALYSLCRVTVGFVLAALVAVPLGILMASFPLFGAFFEPLVVIGGYLPVVTLIPLTIAWFKLGETQKIGFLFIATFVFLLPMVIKSISEVDDVYVKTAYTLGATRWQVVRHVLIPVASARIYHQMRILYGVGWGYIILAEMTELDSPGLGALISLCQRRSHTDRVFAVLFVIMGIAFLVDSALKWYGSEAFPYLEEE